MTIRDARVADAEAIAKIYNSVLRSGNAIYSDTEVTEEDRASWISAKQDKGYRVVVAERAGTVVGFAGFDDFRAWPGYRHTAESTVHIAEGARGTGMGEALMRAVLIAAAQRGKHVVIAGCDAGNTGAIRFHERLGFVAATALPEVGHKNGQWCDLVLMHRFIGAPVFAYEDPEAPDLAAIFAAKDAFSNEGYDPEDCFTPSPAEMKAPGMFFRVCRIEGEIAAIGALKRNADFGEVKGLFVDEAWRGLGLAGAMMEEIGTIARREGIAKLRLETGIHHHGAIRLYERLGWRQIGRFPPYPPNETSLFYETLVS